MHRSHTHPNAGFTIIELTLAMTFLAFVMVFSATIIVQLSQTYSKGLTIKQINQAGRSVTDDLARSLQGAVSGEIDTTQVTNGVLCVGNSAYVWNPIYTNATGTVNGNSDKFKLSGESVTLARVTSDDVNDCATAPSNPNFTSSVDNVSLLGGRARVMTATASKSTIDPRLVTIKFLLGTYDPSEKPAIQSGNKNDITNTVYYDSGQYTCRADRLGNFCAFSEFATTIYVAN